MSGRPGVLTKAKDLFTIQLNEIKTVNEGCMIAVEHKLKIFKEGKGQ